MPAEASPQDRVNLSLIDMMEKRESQMRIVNEEEINSSQDVASIMPKMHL